MERKIAVKNDMVYIPVKKGQSEKLLEVFSVDKGKEKKLTEFLVPIAEENCCSYDYFAHFPAGAFFKDGSADKTLIFRGDVTEKFLEDITCEAEEEIIEEVSSARPLLHFTAKNGWINDPNGLVFDRGIYHLYFQYNPFNTAWNNMSWGHAVSRDLLKWEQLDTVMFPDEEGTIFSGCGLQNEKGMLGMEENALLFFYTAAGDNNPWSKGKQFTQRVAYSLDGGNTFVKMKQPFVDTICKENRDPKVYWHEETGSYIMALWLEENDFGILRSTDLEQWELSDRFCLEGAWECPDLIKLADEEGKEHWIFWSADGFYFFGSFDGYHFRTDGKKHKAYFNTLPYAAQTYAKTKGRTISIPWLRIPNDGRNFTGAMGLPQELGLVKEKDTGMVLCQKPVREFFEKLEWKGEAAEYEAKENRPLYVEWSGKERDCKLTFEVAGLKIVYNPETGLLCKEEESWFVGKNRKEFAFLIDDNIVEVWVEHGIMTGVFVAEQDAKKIKVQADTEEKLKIYEVRT